MNTAVALEVGGNSMAVEMEKEMEMGEPMLPLSKLRVRGVLFRHKSHIRDNRCLFCHGVINVLVQNLVASALFAESLVKGGTRCVGGGIRDALCRRKRPSVYVISLSVARVK